MDARLKAQVRRRAGLRCEYCQFPERFAQKHSGPTTAANLALACFRCNSHKGPNLSGVDPESGQVVRLFHPRQEVWAEHFAWHGSRLVGLTPTGRATIAVLRINRPDAMLARAALLDEGVSFVPLKRRS